MNAYNMVADTNGDTTVVTQYTPVPRNTGYQSEAALEQEMIRLLQENGYEHPDIRDERTLRQNLRAQIEALNNITFTDGEWDRFFKDSIAGKNDGVVEKTARIQRDHVQVLKRDDGTTKNVMLLDKKNVQNNRLQVINQFTPTGGKHANRYDVTILVNGLPLVHCELKRRGVSIREAFNQIHRYSADSFWADSGLFEYVQIFVISNGTETKYYSNTTRDQHVKAGRNYAGGQSKTSKSFVFTSYWADAQNTVIPDLVDFTKTFFARHTLLNILAKYCVFTVENTLLVMRPYQIVAAERIINRIRITTEHKQTGKVDAGGYVWHTTGSGKTLTSFKTAQLASQLDGVNKVLFVVDRKDLDHQTQREYNRYEEGSANGNTSTKILQRQLEDPNAKIIVTTIQKLDRFVAQNKGHKLYKGHVVLIFDECHRSQFGSMHAAITKAFKNYHLFGFTGTPIFQVNAARSAGKGGLNLTTTQLFGKQLHTYTVVDAINDKNVLPWHIDYVRTMHAVEDVDMDEQVEDINRKGALAAPERVAKVVEYVLDHYRRVTRAGHAYMDGGRRVDGFNSIFAADSISMAMQYYDEFRRQIAERADNVRNLKVATIFTFSANDAPDDELFEEDPTASEIPTTAREFLDHAMGDYNDMFRTNFSTDGDGFDRYFKDVSSRTKNREIDILIVVNMFLTGFDAPTLNTLWVDKNLKMHGLIQAFSRTNRILNTVKRNGQIVCFRNLEKQTEEALGLFGNADAAGIVLIRDFESYFNGYTDEKGKHHKGYTEALSELMERFPLDRPILHGQDQKKEFVKLFGLLLRLRNILAAFSEFETSDSLDPRDLQDYQSMYVDLHEEMRLEKPEQEDIRDDLVFEMELVRHTEVTIAYILELVQKYCAEHCTNRELLTDIDRAVSSSLELRSKKELIQKFVESVNPQSDVEADWDAFVAKEREKNLAELIEQEGLKEDATRLLVDRAFAAGRLDLTGTWFDKLLAKPISRFGSARRERKARTGQRLLDYFNTYAGTF